MKYKQAMKSKNKDIWDEAVFKEHEQMVNINIWTSVSRREVPTGAKMLSSTWAMKKKSNGKYIVRLNARGYGQVGGVHYDLTINSSPLINGATVRSVLVLSLISGWSFELIYVQGAFLCGNFKKEEHIYTEAGTATNPGDGQQG
jgi:hypothetical protein